MARGLAMEAKMTRWRKSSTPPNPHLDFHPGFKLISADNTENESENPRGRKDKKGFSFWRTWPLCGIKRVFEKILSGRARIVEHPEQRQKRLFPLIASTGVHPLRLAREH